MECRLLLERQNSHGRWDVLFCVSKRVHLFGEFWQHGKYGEALLCGSGYEGCSLSDNVESFPCTCDQPKTLPPFLEQLVRG